MPIRARINFIGLDGGFNADDLKYVFFKRRRPPSVIVRYPRSGIKNIGPNLWKLQAEATTL